MSNFRQMGLSPSLIRSLDRMSFTEPTSIQEQTIPLALVGKDVLGSAQTGTGKTLAFAIPLIERLLVNPESNALILLPTRELAEQVITVLRQFLDRDSGVRSALLIGGEGYENQFRQLKANPRVVVGTPGRIIDHLKRKTLKIAKTDFLVLDETDRMFDMGFGIQIQEIIAQLPRERQTLMFSATMPQEIVKLASKYLSDPQRISIGSLSSPTKQIKQEVFQVTESEKYGRLLDELNVREGSVIIFVNTKAGCDVLARRLNELSHSAAAMHGDLRQNKRQSVIQSFRKGNKRILVATDVAARGLDIPHVQHVINYELPQCSEDYIHRIGRTARAGADGFALCLVTPRDSRKWKDIQRFMNPGFKDDSNAGGRSERSGESRGGSRSGCFGGRSGGGRSEGRKFNDRPQGDRFGRRSDDNRRPHGERFERSERFGDNRPPRTERTSDGNRSEDRSNRFGDSRRSEGRSEGGNRFGDNRRSEGRSENRFGDNRRGNENRRPSEGRFGDDRRRASGSGFGQGQSKGFKKKY